MVTISVCVGSACHLKGSYDVIEGFKKLIKEHKVSDDVELKGAFCLENCTHGVSVQIDGSDKIYSVNKEVIDEFFKEEILGRIN